MEIRDTAIARIEGFEGVIGHFYLDTKGKVTIGVGLMVPNADAAVPLVLTFDGRAATEAQKRACWTTISQAEAGQAASRYATLAKCRLSAAEARSLLKTRLAQDVVDLKRKFPDLDTYPWAAQDALLDMMYNLGPTQFTRANWPSFFRAVTDKDWRKAGTESNRPDVQSARNAAIKALFEEAADIHRAQAMFGQGLVAELDRVMTGRLAELRDLVKTDDKRLFPGGITHIALTVEVDGTTMALEISGPQADGEA